MDSSTEFSSLRRGFLSSPSTRRQMNLLNSSLSTTSDEITQSNISPVNGPNSIEDYIESTAASDQRVRSVDNRNWECPICLTLYEFPLRTHCGHSFCRECIEKHLSTQSQCPVCRTEISRDSMTEDIQIIKEMSSVFVPCTNIGCKKIFPPIVFRRHVRECEYLRIPCSHETHGCGYQGIRKNLPHHLQDCSYEKIKNFFPKVYKQIEHVHEIAHTLEHRLMHVREGMVRQEAVLRQMRALSSDEIHHYFIIVHGIFWSGTHFRDRDRWVSTFSMHWLASVLLFLPPFLAALADIPVHYWSLDKPCTIVSFLCKTYHHGFLLLLASSTLFIMLLLEGGTKNWKYMGSVLGELSISICSTWIFCTLSHDLYILVIICLLLPIGMERNIVQCKFSKSTLVSLICSTAFQFTSFIGWSCGIGMSFVLFHFLVSLVEFAEKYIASNTYDNVEKERMLAAIEAFRMRLGIQRSHQTYAQYLTPSIISIIIVCLYKELISIFEILEAYVGFIIISSSLGSMNLSLERTLMTNPTSIRSNRSMAVLCAFVKHIQRLWYVGAVISYMVLVQSAIQGLFLIA